MFTYKRFSSLIYKFSGKVTYSTSTKNIKACVVGAGPAGFYTCQYLLKHQPNSQVE